MYLRLPGERCRRGGRHGLVESLGKCRASKEGGFPHTVGLERSQLRQHLLPAGPGTGLRCPLGRKTRGDCPGPMDAHGWKQWE